MTQLRDKNIEKISGDISADSKVLERIRYKSKYGTVGELLEQWKASKMAEEEPPIEPFGEQPLAEEPEIDWSQVNWKAFANEWYKREQQRIFQEYQDIADYTVAGWQERRTQNPERVEQWQATRSQAWETYQAFEPLRFMQSPFAKGLSAFEAALTTGGAILTQPFRPRAVGPEGYPRTFLPGGAEYEAYRKWRERPPIEIAPGIYSPLSPGMISDISELGFLVGGHMFLSKLFGMVVRPITGKISDIFWQSEWKETPFYKDNPQWIGTAYEKDLFDAFKAYRQGQVSQSENLVRTAFDRVSAGEYIPKPVAGGLPVPAEVTAITYPKPTGLMADLQPAQQAINIATKGDFARAIAGLPIIRNIMKVVNPSAVAGTPAEQAIVLRGILRDEGMQKSKATMAHLEELGTQDKVFGKLDASGRLTQGDLKGLVLNDIRTYPQRYAEKLTPAQKRWIERASDIEDAKLEFLKRNGIDINELTFEEGGQYAGRRVYGRQSSDGEFLESGYVGAGPGRVGKKLAAEKVRVFKTADEAVRAGFRYLPEDEALSLNVQGAYNRIADKQMADWLLTQVPWRTTGAPEELVLAAYSAKVTLNKGNQLLAALNRAVRGERVPTQTINSIASVHPGEAGRLKGIIGTIQEGKKATAEVRSLRTDAKAIIENSRREYQRAVNARARARELALRPRYGEAQVAAPAFAGKIFTGPEARALADTLREGLEPKFARALGSLNKVNAVSRYFMLAGDFSPATIQLLYLFGGNPKAYVRAIAGMVNSLFDKRYLSYYHKKHIATINKHPNLLLTKAGATEFTEAMAKGGFLSPKMEWLPRWEPVWKQMGLAVPRAVGITGATVLEPFQRAFEGALDVAGIEMAESLDHLCTTAERTAQVDDFVNEFRGLMSTAKLGVPSNQRLLETAIFLAPRYNRAIASLLFDTVQGNLRGKLARMTLIKGLTAVTMMAVAISIARGESREEVVDHLNPTSPNFMTWGVAGQKVGPGSKIRSLLRLFGQVWNAIEEGEPEKIIEFSMDNPVMRFLRGNLSPVLGSAIDILTGKNYIGEPVRNNWESFTERIIAENLLPIWVENVLMEGGDPGARTIRGLAEFMGGRAYPETTWDKLKPLREKYAKADYGKDYESLNNLQIQELRRKHSDLDELEKQAKAEWAERGEDWESIYLQLSEETTLERDNGLEVAAQSLLDGKISKYQYDKERSYIKPYYSGAKAILWRFKELLDPKTVERIERWMTENQALEDKALDEYLEYRATLIEKAELPRDWDKIEKQCEAFLKRYSKAILDYIKASETNWIKDLPSAAQEVEMMRYEGMQDESWWKDYRKTKPTRRTPPIKIPTGGVEKGKTVEDLLREHQGE